MGIKFTVGNNDRSVPPGDYKVKVEDIKEAIHYKRRTLVMTFQVVEGPHAGAGLRAFVNASYEKVSAFTKLFQWYSVVAGEEPEANQQLDTDVFRDKILLVSVQDKQSRKTKNVFSHVTDIKKVIYDL